MITQLYIGATIRPLSQPSAVAVTQVEWGYNIQTQKRQDHYTLRFMEAIAARTPYPDMAVRLAQIVNNLRIQAAQFKTEITLYVDVTGLGEAIVDLIKVKADPIIPCYLTKTDKRVTSDRKVVLGKAWLVARLQTLFQGGRITLPRTAVARLLIDELMTYALDPAPSEDALTGTFVVGTQDELLTALGLACQGPTIDQFYADEFLEHMHRQVQGSISPRGASKEWMREWSGEKAVKSIDPFTMQPIDPRALTAAHRERIQKL